MSQALGIECITENSENILHSIIELIQNDQFLKPNQKIELADWFEGTYNMFRRIQ